MTPADRVPRVSDAIEKIAGNTYQCYGDIHDIGRKNEVVVVPREDWFEVLEGIAVFRDARQSEAAKDATIAEQAAEIARLKRDAATREREAVPTEQVNAVLCRRYCGDDRCICPAKPYQQALRRSRCAEDRALTPPQEGEGHE